MNPSYKTYSVTADCCLYLIYNIRFNYQNIFISDHAMELINMTHVFLEKKIYTTCAFRNVCRIHVISQGNVSLSVKFDKKGVRTDI